MDERSFLTFSLLDKRYYEHLNRYAPADDYRSRVESLCGEEWRVVPKGFWTHVQPRDYAPLDSGWKIHVSAISDTAVETLDIVSRLLVEMGVAFKFTSDPKMMALSLNKNWVRAQVGKFIAIYPADVEECHTVLEALYERTGHLKGPYVLTDRPYKDSAVVFYRYGQHRGSTRPDYRGHLIQGYTGQDGKWRPDPRLPYFELPDGIEDPFQTKPATTEGTGEVRGTAVLLRDRYEIIGALKYNALGGIYFGLDTHTSREVVVREIRLGMGLLTSTELASGPHTVHKEARILRKLAATGLVPEFVDLFEESGHWFLVVERLVADSIWARAMSFYFESEGESPNVSFTKFVNVALRIGNALKTVHAHNVVLRDLTKSNVLITPDNKIKFIDLEFAHDLDTDDRWINGWTSGYATEEQKAGERPAPAHDWFAFGALMLDMLAFNAAGIELDRGAVLRKLAMNLFDYGYPAALGDVIDGLTRPSATERWSLDKAMEALAALPVPTDLSPMRHLGEGLHPYEPPSVAGIEALEAAIEGISIALRASSTPDRSDRLWPTAPEMYSGNPASLEWGAAGPAMFLQSAEGHVEAEALDWISARAKSDDCAPGLMSGQAGIALLLLRAGRSEPAAEIMRSAARSALITECHGLYYGAAGWGLSNLHFWLENNDEVYLKQAVSAGEHLLRTAIFDSRGAHWEHEGKVHLGYAEGQAGVALFLTYLALAAARPKYLELATRALDHDASHQVYMGGRILFTPRVGMKGPNSPHMMYGAGGVGTAALRCHAATGLSQYLDLARECALSQTARFTNKNWQNHGLAGAGEYLLDMHRFSGDVAYRNAAFDLADGILPCRIDEAGGTAFAGYEFLRVCSDYAMGTSGIGIFLHRLLTGGERLLMLDHHFFPASEKVRDRRVSFGVEA